MKKSFRAHEAIGVKLRRIVAILGVHHAPDRTDPRELFASAAALESAVPRSTAMAAECSRPAGAVTVEMVKNAGGSPIEPNEEQRKQVAGR